MLAWCSTIHIFQSTGNFIVIFKVDVQYRFPSPFPTSASWTLAFPQFLKTHFHQSKSPMNTQENFGESEMEMQNYKQDFTIISSTIQPSEKSKKHYLIIPTPVLTTYDAKADFHHLTKFFHQFLTAILLRLTAILFRLTAMGKERLLTRQNGTASYSMSVSQVPMQ